MMFTTYLLLYALIGLGVALYLPYRMARTTHLWDHHVSSEKLRAMTPRERAILESVVDVGRAPIATWQLVLAGILWPVQIVGYVIAVVWGWFFDRRVKR